MGYENYVDKARIVAVLSIESSPAKKLVKKAETDGHLIDVTAGKKRKSIVLTDCNRVFVTAKNPTTVMKAWHGQEPASAPPQDGVK